METGIGPPCAASGWLGAATGTMRSTPKSSASIWSGQSRTRQLMPIWQLPSITSSATPPSASRRSLRATLGYWSAKAFSAVASVSVENSTSY